MKTNFFVFLCFLLLSLGIKAQSKYGTDSVNCVINLSLYREYYKQKNYDDALKPWRWVYNNCPASSSNIFKNGPMLFKYLIKKDDVNKQAYIDTLMMIHDKRIQYFGKEGYVLGKKGADLINYNSTSYQEAYSILSKSIQIQGNSSEAGVLVAFLKATTIMQRNGLVDKKTVLNCYAKVSKINDYNIINNAKKTKYYEQASEIIESLFAPYANCDDLIVIFSEKVERMTEDTDFLNRVIKLLDSKKCKNNKLYFDAVSRLHELLPSALLASKIGKMNMVKNKYSEAINFFKQATDIEENSNKRGLYYLELSNAYRISGSYISARSMAYKSAELRPDWGEPFISIANTYISSIEECSSSDFQKATLYWVAVDKFIKAKSVDPSIADKANKAISTYSNYFPSTEMCFFEGIKVGQRYLIECWINESTQVRTND